MINQIDPVNQLANNIVNSISQIASSKALKASYDKTYVVTILGVGQDFTDDVAQAEQESIVKKYNIPAVSNDDTIYYTFKLEGIYYSVRQNGNFNLYDQTLLRVPNNNWDRMFLERLGGEESDKNAQRNFYVAVNEPPIAGKDYGTGLSGFVYTFWVKVKIVKDDSKTEVVFDKLYRLDSDDYLTAIPYDNYAYYKEVGCLYEFGTVAGAPSEINVPPVDIKLVEQYNGEYYWLRKSSDGLSISNIYRCIKKYNEETGLYKYQWDLEHPLFAKEIYDESKSGEQNNQNAIELSKDYNFYPNSSSAVNYHEEEETRSSYSVLYLSLLPPMVEGDMWFQIDDNLTRVVNALYQCYDVSKERNSATKYEWQKVANFFDGQIIVSEIEAGAYQKGDLWIKHAFNDEGNWEAFEWSGGYVNSWLPGSIYPYPNVSFGDNKVEKGQYYAKTDLNYKITEVYIGTNTSKEWNAEFTEMIYPENENGQAIRVFDTTAPPDADGLIWAQVDNTVGCRVLAISRCLHKKWELKYRVGARKPLIIPYPTEPIIELDDDEELHKGDCYVYYKEESQTVNNETQIIKTFDSLYQYIPSWEKINGVVQCGDKLPEQGHKGDYFIIADEDFANVAVYVCIADSSDADPEGEGGMPAKWEDATEGTTFAYPYPPFQEGDYWVKINSIQGKQAQSLYIYFEGEWLLFLNVDGGGVGEFMDPPGSGTPNDYTFNTSERFNDYRTHEFNERTQKWSGGNWSVMKHDHVEGYGNKVVFDESNHPAVYVYTPSGYNHIEGYENYVNIEVNSSTGRLPQTPSYNHIEGYHNHINSSDNNDRIRGNHIEGDSNIVEGQTYNCHVGGYKNDVDKGGNSIIHGSRNHVGYAYCSAVFGENNAVGINRDGTNGHASCAGVFGSSNLVNRDDCVVIGSGNTVEFGGPHLVVGDSGQPNSFTVDGAGNVTAKKIEVRDQVYADMMYANAFLPRGADYAEYFEWLDGNPESEDRCGMLVTLDEDKIMLANDDNVFGIVSASPAMVGNSYEEYWHGKYVKDVYGRRIVDENGEYIISPDYDDTQEYIPRSQRPEWAPIGIVGKFIINDDGSCVSGKFVVAINGIGTLSNKNTGIRMLRRIDESHIEVFMK